MSTDYRALCSELTEKLHKYTSLYEGHESELVTRALAELAQPEPKDLFARIDTLLDGIDRDECHPDGGWWQTSDGSTFGRIKLRKLKELIASSLSLSRPTIQPVPVSERLPEPEDCDAEGRCWWWHPAHIEDDFDNDWVLLNHEWAGLVLRDSDNSPIYTHWLPANALPTPEANQ